MKGEPGPRLRILSVEDEALNRALLAAVLQGSSDERLRDAELIEATSLAEARRLVADSDHDLVILDRRLPDGDGFELAHELAHRPAASRPPIIALTADAVPATEQAATAAGCTTLIVKPYRPAELTAALAELLDDRRPTLASR
ncbi:MAG: response regulator [Chloroflexota bacterium]|nr:response regulator [Chloroflexota bacterium]